MAVTTLGRLMVKGALPLRFKGRAASAWTKDDILNITTLLAKLDPLGYIDVLSRLNAIGLYVVSTYGRLAGLTVKDVDSSKAVKSYVAKFQQLINNILNNDKISNALKLRQITLLGYKYSDKIKLTVVLDHKHRGTALYAQMKAKARGNPMQMTQLNFGDLGVRDALNRDIPYFACSPRSNGASPFSMWVGASSSRKGFYDVQALTGRAGYLGKQASNATHSTPIILLDCGTTDTGIVVPADTDCVGSVLLRPFKNHPAGTVVTLDILADCALDDKLIVRSPTTCKSAYGVCAHCSGLDLNDKFPAIGLYVALNATKTFVLKATQAGVGSKHTGGTGGKRVLSLDGDDQPTGMDALLRIFFVPSTFPGGAVLSSVDGTVNEIKPAPQGGHYITVGSTTTYAPAIRKVRVSVGDTVTAGDKLTNGVPNPVEIVQYKGLGQGRLYFIQQLNKTLKSNGWGVHKRNLLQFSRSFLNKVRITDPLGYLSYLPGDVVDYSIVQSIWQPRLDAVKADPSKAKDMYLLAPILHYTIGTRITPSVISTLKLNGFNLITVHKLAPPFLALFVRSQSIVLKDKNWMPRLMGLRLQDSLFDAAQQGITDRYDSPSYVDKVIASPYKPKGQP